MKTTIRTSAGLLAVALFASAASAQWGITEEETAKICELQPGVPCGSGITGTVAQLLAGKDVYAVKRGGKYITEYYPYAHVFQQGMKQSEQTYATLAELNTALAALKLSPVSEADLTGPCMILPGKKCEGADAGIVKQTLLAGKDVHVVKENGKYLAKYYEVTRTFQKDKSLGDKSFPTLKGLNKHLAAAGFPAASEADVTGPCFINPGTPCQGAAAGKVMQLIKGKDIHICKKRAKYVATTYSYGNVFNKHFRTDRRTFKTLKELNAYIRKEFSLK